MRATLSTRVGAAVLSRPRLTPAMIFVPCPAHMHAPVHARSVHHGSVGVSSTRRGRVQA